MTFNVPLLPKRIRWSLVIVVSAVIIYYSIFTVPPGTPIDTVRFDLFPEDKWRHFVAYGAFAASLVYATTDWNLRPRWNAIAIFTVTVFFGLGIEIAQSFQPMRYFSILDAYANAMGALVVLPWYLVTPYLEFVSWELFKY